MSIYSVHMIQTVSTTVEVEAASVEEAIDLTLQNAPSPTNSTNEGIDPSGDWTENAVYDAAGNEVWNDRTGDVP